MVPELFCKNVPESLYVENMGTMLPMVTWCVTNFGHFITLYFNEILSAKRVWPNMATDTLYVKSLPIPWKNQQTFIVTSCFSVGELVSNWLTWTFGKKCISFPCIIDCALWEQSMLQGTYFVSVESMSG